MDFEKVFLEANDSKSSLQLAGYWSKFREGMLERRSWRAAEDLIDGILGQIKGVKASALYYWDVTTSSYCLMCGKKKGFRPTLSQDRISTSEGVWRYYQLDPGEVANSNPAEIILAIKANNHNQGLRSRLEYFILEMGQVTILKKRLYEAEKLAYVDQLTGLYNKRAMIDLLGKMVGRVRRLSDSDAKFGVIMIDIDDFKHYNDNFGHSDGDVVLSSVGRLISKSIRSNDYGCRYGGEEMCILLPDAAQADLEIVAERVRAVIESHQFNHRSVTVSVGAACYPEDYPDECDASYKGILSIPDQFLYYSKAHGKNQVTTSSNYNAHRPALIKDLLPDFRGRRSGSGSADQESQEKAPPK